MYPVIILCAPLRPSVVNSGLGSEQPNYEMRQKREKPRGDFRRGKLRLARMEEGSKAYAPKHSEICIGPNSPLTQETQLTQKMRKRQRGEIRPWRSLFGIGGLVF